MNYNIIYADDKAYEILTEISVHMFLNRNNTVNQRVLGMYVHEWDGDRVMKKDNKLLICKTIEEAQII
jgi:hypothetical protein